MKKEKILIISDIPPCTNYSGGIFGANELEYLLENQHELYLFVPYSPFLNPKFDESIMNKVDYKFTERPNEFFDNDTKIKEYNKKIKFVKKKLLDYVEKNKIKKILVLTQGKCTLDLINYVTRKIKNIEYSLQILDPLEWWMKEHKFNKKLISQTLQEFSYAIKNANSVLVISENMKKLYEEKYGVQCDVTYPSITKKRYQKENSNENIIKIALSGQIYAKKEFNYLLKTLTKNEWKINNKEVFLHFYGEWCEDFLDKDFNLKYRDNIITHGFIPQENLLYELSQHDVLYCPYFISDDPTYNLVSKVSFPSKLVTYLSLETPILVHAPKDSSPYDFVKKHNCGYVCDKNDENELISILKDIVNSNKNTKIDEDIFNRFFSHNSNKIKLYKALSLTLNNENILRILEVNNVDMHGRRFNGYDLIDVLNKDSKYYGNQIVTYKLSNNKNVYKFYENGQEYKEWDLVAQENNLLSVHNVLSYTSNILKNHQQFKKADLVHYHLIHNTKLSLVNLDELFMMKPTVFTIHDPWIFTGRCVYPQECNKWKNGCKNCQHLDNLFALKKDNCDVLYKLKKKQYEKWDIDIIITTGYMQDMIDKCSITNFKNVHMVPFGIDTNKFKNDNKKSKYREEFGIEDDEIVLFFRSQMAMKGTEYIVEALKQLKTNKKVTLLTCSEKGNLKTLKNKYKIIELGDIFDDVMIKAYNAADIFLMPSKGESFGLMAIEAMACEKPIIIFDNSALPYVTFAPECGILVKNKDSKDLCEKIEWLIENPMEIERRGKLGRQKVLENYDLDKYNDKIKEIYEKAYDRQKYKLIKYEKEFIDYEDENIINLIPKLEKILFNLNPYVSTPKFLKLSIKKDAKKNQIEKIDYSNTNVINLIKKFNDYIYEVNLKNYNSVYYGYNCYKEKFEKIHNLKEKLYPILYKNKIIFVLTKKIYVFLRKIYYYFKYEKNIEKKYLKDTLINQQTEITQLKKEIEYLTNLIKKLK